MAAGRPQVQLREDTYCPTLSSAFDALCQIFHESITIIALAIAFAMDWRITPVIAGMNWAISERDCLRISGLQGGIFLKLSPGEDNRSFGDGLASHV